MDKNTEIYGMSCIPDMAHGEKEKRQLNKREENAGLICEIAELCNRFENCGIEKYELHGLQKEAFSNILHKLPNIIDVPGT
ncbi:hypothetical protein DPMN_105417 [Dreissena polymorpha]|uniref:Uncharacterized protein n=1 Tax=Dreissena polymorpha TaxID=45954 RepID=A0A9D4HDA9_DREPO|nr:hypothetical protein DPMN_105417 [Dreissena polymorpha]